MILNVSVKILKKTLKPFNRFCFFENNQFNYEQYIFLI